MHYCHPFVPKGNGPLDEKKLIDVLRGDKDLQ